MNMYMDKNKRKHEQNKNRSFKNLRNFIRNSHYYTENDGYCFFSPLEIQAVKKTLPFTKSSLVFQALH